MPAQRWKRYSRCFKLKKTPWEVFRALAPGSRICFFLDSHSFHPPKQRYSYLGFDPFLEIRLNASVLEMRGVRNGRVPSSRWASTLRQIFKQYQLVGKSAPYFTGGAVGFWSYEFAAFLDRIHFRRKPGPDMPLAFLGFYREIVVYDHKTKTFRLVVHGNKSDLDTAYERLRTRLQSSGPFRFEKPFHLKQFEPELSRTAFLTRVRRAKEYIRAGDIYQANLSQRFSFRYGGDPLHLYERLRRINPSPFASYLRQEDWHIVSASPERLFQKKGRWCETEPIAGTRPRGKRRRDGALVRELALNAKERAEHIMLVDLERNDLGRVCDWPTVKVSEMMKVEKYSHVMHLVSKIRGRLQTGKDNWDVLQAMFPGGTITGCPKIRCMEIIDELEPLRRGIYTGSLGYVDFHGNADLNIVIRTLALHRRGHGYFQVGAGIVADSDPEREYDETLHKGEALAEALVSDP